MKKSILSAFSLILLLVLCAGCEKLTPSNSTNNNPDELDVEEAYPGRTGEIVDVTFNGETVECEFIDGEYILEGDIIITPDNNKNLKGVGIDFDDMKWPYGWVYYSISEDFEKQQRITDAIKHLEDKTDIQFKERTDEPDYILFVNHTGNSSKFGRKGGMQEIKTSSDAPMGTVVHEIGHALGLLHEQSRSDRDNYVNVHWDNIKEGREHNFRLVNCGITTQEFDFGSIMIYSSWAFRKNRNQPTMTKLDGSTWNRQLNSLSEMDCEIIARLYSEIHEPVLVDMLTDDDYNVGITSDGEYYYTCSLLSSTIRKISRDGSTIHGRYPMSTSLNRPTGIAYNKSDGLLYVSNHEGDIIRITDLENGQWETVYHDIMQSDWASFALSEDGSKMFDFYNGTVKVYDFRNGDLLNTLNDLWYGTHPYYDDAESISSYGATAIAVDASFIYTWDCSLNPGEVYVYDHNGDYMTVLEVGSGYNGLSLSVIDGYLFVSYDPTYDPGTWYKYNIRNPID